MESIEEAKAVGCNDTELCLEGKGFPGVESKGKNKIGAWCHKKRNCGFLIWKRNVPKNE